MIDNLWDVIRAEVGDGILIAIGTWDEALRVRIKANP